MSLRFSVLVPVYNRPGLVRETIDSILAQTYRGFEVIAIDDGSTDNTLEVLRSYGDRIRVLTQKNSGPEAARHRAAAVAQGEYFVLLDSDDLLYPHALAVYDRALQQFQSPPVLIGAMRAYRKGDAWPGPAAGNESADVYRFDNFFSRNVMFGTTCSELVVRRDVVAATGAFPASSTAFPVDTADMLLNLGASGPWIVVKEPATIAYRIHETNTIGNVDYMAKSVIRLLRLERSGRYPGGPGLRFGRRAYIGGVAWHWFRNALRAGKPGLALHLGFACAPAITFGVMRRLRSRFRPPATPIRVAV
jgi:glycosyltransferase involved in cell wall biosynthesis